jgi:hypothetical protein
MWSPWRTMFSMRSPVSLMRLGISMAASGSVQWTSSRSPGLILPSALRVFNAGKGHFNPVKSSWIVAMRDRMTKTARFVNERAMGLNFAQIRVE